MKWFMPTTIYEVIPLLHALSEKYIYVLFSVINNIQNIKFVYKDIL